jgi:hypothetical protein
MHAMNDDFSKTGSDVGNTHVSPPSDHGYSSYPIPLNPSIPPAWTQHFTYPLTNRLPQPYTTSVIHPTHRETSWSQYTRTNMLPRRHFPQDSDRGENQKRIRCQGRQCYPVPAPCLPRACRPSEFWFESIIGLDIYSYCFYDRSNNRPKPTSLRAK